MIVMEEGMTVRRRRTLTVSDAARRQCVRTIDLALQRGNHAEALAALGRAFDSMEVTDDETPVEMLNLYGGARTCTILRASGIKTLGDLRAKRGVLVKIRAAKRGEPRPVISNVGPFLAGKILEVMDSVKHTRIRT